MPETQGSSKQVHILDRIVETKRQEVARLRSWESALKAGAALAPAPRDFTGRLRQGDDVALIAEVKRRSPGAGPIREGLNAPGLATTYVEGGARALSVLTDEEYFAGSLDDLRAVRDAVVAPILRKDFIIDEVQVYEARGAGADAILLIVRILDDDALARLHALGRELGMSVLVEVHGSGEMERALAAGADVIGINNRDLSTFTTDLDVTLEMVAGLPQGVTVVSESGIRTRDDVARLGAAGVHAILVGESLLRAPDPGTAVSELVGIPRV